MAVTWGSIVGSYGRIGIQILKVAEDDDSITFDISVWFWSKYSVSDSGNTLYANSNSSSATTSRGSRNIDTNVGSGSGWSTSNQQKIFQFSDATFTKGTSSVKHNAAARLTGVDRVGGTMKVVASYTVPALAYHNVKYNANGGSGAPSSQKKYYGKTLTLSSTKPTRTGYTFQGWALSSTATTAAYQPGGSYTRTATANSTVTLYAVWKANTYTVTFNANGGTGGPTTQTKTYGVNLTLSISKPTRTNYNFLGWSTDPNASTVEYSSGGTYSSNSAVTLYAVWQLAYIAPKVTGFSVDRCNSGGTLSEEGTYCKVVFNWQTDNRDVSSITIGYKASNTSSFTNVSVSAAGMSGSVNQIIGGGALNSELDYTIRVIVADSGGSSTYDMTLPSVNYVIDFHVGGDGVSIGKPASSSGFHVYTNATLHNPVNFEGSLYLSNSSDVHLKNSSGANSQFLDIQGNGRPTIMNHIGLANGMWLQGQLASGSFSNILRMNSDGSVELNWTENGMRGRMYKQLWSGSYNTASSTASISIPELPYYNILVVKFSGRDARILCVRNGSYTSWRAFLGIAAYSSATAMTLYSLTLTLSSDTVVSSIRANTRVNVGNLQTNVGTVTSIEGVL